MYDGISSPEVKRPDHEAGHLPSSSVEVKNSWSSISTPPLSLHGVVRSETQGSVPNLT